MSRHGIAIGRIFGIRIDLDYSWFFIAALLTWMLAGSFYPAQFKGWAASEYWLIGGLTSLLLFASVLVHELGHSLVARRYGLEVPRITLFLFGGVAQLQAEPPHAWAEFWIALAGPVTSFLLAAGFWELEPLMPAQPMLVLVRYLAVLNLMLALFNLIPGFPLDGGRVFRALLWRFTHSYHRATMAAGLTGRFFGFLFIFLGVWQALAGALVDGLWLAFVGWFLESAAGSQLHVEWMKNLLGGHRVADAMERNLLHVPPGASVEETVERVMIPAQTRTALVTTIDGTVGVVTLDALHGVPRAEWSATSASHVMSPVAQMETTQPDAILWAAVERMGKGGVEVLPVLERGVVVGMLSREDILHYLSVLQGLQEWKSIDGAR